MVVHRRRTIVECCAGVRSCDMSLDPNDLPLSGLGLHSPVRGLSLDSIFENERLARWFVMRPSRNCRGLAGI